MATTSTLSRQLIRYGISGLGVTVFFALVYEAVLQMTSAGPQTANVLGFLCAVCVGYVIHSRWTFQDHGTREAPLRNTGRFLIVNLAGFALNSFWVWLIAGQLGLSEHLPLIPIVFITPWLSFWLNRQWTFG